MSDLTPPQLYASTAEDEGRKYTVFYETKSGARAGKWIAADSDDVLEVGGEP